MPVSSCMKTLFILTYMFLIIQHLAVIAGTIYIVVELQKYQAFLFYDTFLPLIFSLIFKLVQLFGHWHGFLGLRKEEKINILTFCCMLLIIIIFDILIGIWTLVERDNVHVEVRSNIEESFNNYVMKHYGKEAWDNLQKQLQCCGVEGPASYSKSTDFIPMSCCNFNATQICAQEFYKTGCLEAVLIHTRNFMFYFIALDYLYVIMQVLSLSVYCQFYSTIEKVLRRNLHEKQLERRPLSRR